jgi:hypothetical protein
MSYLKKQRYLTCLFFLIRQLLFQEPSTITYIGLRFSADETTLAIVASPALALKLVDEVDAERKETILSDLSLVNYLCLSTPPLTTEQNKLERMSMAQVFQRG